MERFVVLFEAPAMSAKDYDAILKEMESKGNLYTSQRVSHVAYERKGHWCIVDVWNSLEAFQQFTQNTLAPIFAKLNLNPPPPTVLPAYRYLGVHAEESITA